MRTTLTKLTSGLSLPALLLPLLLLATSCGDGIRADGRTSFLGIIYLALAIFALLSLLKQDWSLTKKLVWGAIIWFFPFLGSIIYFLFSGRSK